LDIAAAIAGSFTSRNNDVDGYWALGMLRSYADANNIERLRFDPMKGHVEPEDALLLRVAETYRRMLVRQLITRRIAIDAVVSAEVILSFDRDAPATTDGSPFSCTVRLTDARDRAEELSIAGRCAPHDPQRERRSGRSEEPAAHHRSGVASVSQRSLRPPARKGAGAVVGRPYTRAELQAAVDDLPDRGQECDQCGALVPQFLDLTEVDRARILRLIVNGQGLLAQAELRACTDAPPTFARTWLLHLEIGTKVEPRS